MGRKKKDWEGAAVVSKELEAVVKPFRSAPYREAAKLDVFKPDWADHPERLPKRPPGKK
jgi:hypothetical protein